MSNACSIEGCGKPVKARGWCRWHYDRLHKLHPWEPKTCTVEGCVRRAIRNGLCDAHSQRLRKRGTLGDAKIESRNGEPITFMRTVALSYASDECLTWPFARSGKGYGQYREHGETKYVHRFLCEQVHGSQPSNIHEVAHNCGKGHLGCINPRHLRWATPKENSADQIIHGTRKRVRQ